MFLNDFFLWVQELPFLSTWRGDIFSCLKLTAWHNRHGCGGPGLKWVGPTWACPPPPVGRLVGLLLLLLVGPHTHTHTLGPCCPVSPLLSCWPRPAAAYSAPAWPRGVRSARSRPAGGFRLNSPAASRESRDRRRRLSGSDVAPVPGCSHSGYKPGTGRHCGQSLPWLRLGTRLAQVGLNYSHLV